jgi:hypothetical protein
MTIYAFFVNPKPLLSVRIQTLRLQIPGKIAKSAIRIELSFSGFRNAFKMSQYP